MTVAFPGAAADGSDPAENDDPADPVATVPIQAAVRRAVATVGLDLRIAGRAAAVAVDGKGALVAWAVVAAEGDPVALARLAVAQLAVRPRAVRVLLGSAAAQVGLLTGPAGGAAGGAPEEREILDALHAEGYERLRAPATAGLAVATALWLVAAAGADAVQPLAEGLLEATAVAPDFVVDQLLAVARVEAGAALVEYGETGLLIAARPTGAAPFVRSIPAVWDAEEAARETRESLAAAGFARAVQVLGARRGELCRCLTAGSQPALPALLAPLPTLREHPLPEECELAWRLALGAAVPALASPALATRRRSLQWARRLTWVAFAMALLGVVLMGAGLLISGASRGKTRALAATTSGVARQMEELRKLGAQAEAMGRVKAELAGQSVPFPRLAEAVASLARAVPPGVGWKRLKIADGTLELEASATGPNPLSRLAQLRQALERSPVLVNLSWLAPVADPPGAGLRQVFKATLHEPTRSAP
jgi:Tfp pilus assembly protein PilN